MEREREKQKEERSRERERERERGGGERQRQREWHGVRDMVPWLLTLFFVFVTLLFLQHHNPHRTVIHRDIKPGNLLLDKTGAIKVSHRSSLTLTSAEEVTSNTL